MMADNKEQRVCVKFCFLLGKSAPHPPYSPDLMPLDFFLCPRIKGQKKGKRYAEVSEVKKETLEVLNNISIEDFQKCFQQWEKHWYKCIELKGEYFEGD
jgi:hypothetical protein